MGDLSHKLFKRGIPFSKQRKGKCRPKEARSWVNLMGILKRSPSEKVGLARNVSFGSILKKNYSLPWKSQCPNGKLEKGKTIRMAVFRGGLA